MAMPKAGLKEKTDSKAESGVEYSIYIFYRPFHNDNNVADPMTWEKRHTTRSIRAAYRKAEKLFRTKAYDRVEIKKKFFDRKAACKTDRTLKIYQKEEDRLVGLFILPAFILVTGCVLAAMAWTLLPADLPPQ